MDLALKRSTCDDADPDVDGDGEIDGYFRGNLVVDDNEFNDHAIDDDHDDVYGWTVNAKAVGRIWKRDLLIVAMLLMGVLLQLCYYAWYWWWPVAGGGGGWQRQSACCPSLVRLSLPRPSIPPPS